MNYCHQVYRTANKGQYYPQGLMSTIYHLGSGLIYDAILSAGCSEHGCAMVHMSRLLPEDVLVLDRGYFSYLMLYKAVESGIHLICRLKSGGNRSIKAFMDSELTDAVIEYMPSATTKATLQKRGEKLSGCPIKLRLIKYRIEQKTYVCATTLMGERYPLEEFPSVYHGRWGIEELYKISKQFVEVEDFHGRAERGVKQELYAHIVLINIARIFESEANPQLPPRPDKSARKSTDIKGSYWQDFCGKTQALKVNFKNCLLVVCRFLEKLVMVTTQKVNDWLWSMLVSISGVRQKIRSGRHTKRQSRKPDNRWRSSHAAKLKA